MRIVIVEDEIKIREGMAKLIESQTEHVVLGEAVDGKDGLEMILRFRPDLVITDIKMPKMDGLEMVRELHERKLSLHVVILTGYSEFEYAQKALRYGVDDYLLKPLAIDDIRDMLAKVEEKLKKEQMTNGTPGQHVRNLIVGDGKDADKHCSILKELCGFPSEGIMNFSWVISVRQSCLTGKSWSILWSVCGRKTMSLCSVIFTWKTSRGHIFSDMENLDRVKWIYWRSWSATG